LDALGRVVDGVLKVLVQVRNTDQPTKKSAGRKKKNPSAAQEKAADYALIWDDDVVKRLIGDRKECLHMAELIWNISHQLLGLSASPDCESDARGSQPIYLRRAMTSASSPTRNRARRSARATWISISKTCRAGRPSRRLESLVPVAKVPPTGSHVTSRASLYRLACAQEELELNCEDTSQREENHKLIALLTLRCLVGVGDDHECAETLNGGGLSDALCGLHTAEISSGGKSFLTLKNVYLLSLVAAERGRSMRQSAACLRRLCAKMMAQASLFVLDFCEGKPESLASLQLRAIKSAGSIDEVFEVLEEVSKAIEKKGGDDENFYTPQEMDALTVEAHNNSVRLDRLGNYNEAVKFSEYARGFVQYCGKEVITCHKTAIENCFKAVTDKANERASWVVVP
ncbi:hypothetical protein THAOC_03946, partial [Thalassiosira oceanica]